MGGDGGGEEKADDAEEEVLGRINLHHCLPGLSPTTGEGLLYFESVTEGDRRLDGVRGVRGDATTLILDDTVLPAPRVVEVLDAYPILGPSGSFAWSYDVQCIVLTCPCILRVLQSVHLLVHPALMKKMARRGWPRYCWGTVLPVLLRRFVMVPMPLCSRAVALRGPLYGYIVAS